MAVLGRNGAGKTTFVRILSTLLAPDAGRIRVAGVDVVNDAKTVRSLIGLAGQFAAVDETLSGRENLVLVGRLYGLPRREARARASEVLERLGLSDAGDRLVRTYSGGMRRRLDLGASLVGHPLVLIMDEPSTGLDPRSRIELWSLIDEFVDAGTTLLLTTQYLEEADRLADRVAVIERGRLIAEGTPDELKQRIGGDARPTSNASPPCSAGSVRASPSPTCAARASPCRRPSACRRCWRQHAASRSPASRSWTSACAGPRSTTSS
jgi:ABC-type multidrug transport system ATPase subunit